MLRRLTWWLRVCRCGHGRDAHRHYRGGSDCSACTCRRFRGGFKAGGQAPLEMTQPIVAADDPVVTTLTGPPLDPW